MVKRLLFIITFCLVVLVGCYSVSEGLPETSNLEYNSKLEELTITSSEKMMTNVFALNDLYGIRDENGEKILEAEWNEILPFNDELILISGTSGSGLMDSSYSFALFYENSSISLFPDEYGLVAITITGDGALYKTGFLDLQGRLVIEPIYSFFSKWNPVMCYKC